MQVGINHFETARMYGTSELQYGQALKKYNRADYILQTKVVLWSVQYTPYTNIIYTEHYEDYTLHTITRFTLYNIQHTLYTEHHISHIIFHNPQDNSLLPGHYPFFYPY